MIPYYILAIEDETDRAYMTALFFQYQKLMYSTIQKVTNDHLWRIRSRIASAMALRSSEFGWSRSYQSPGSYCVQKIMAPLLHRASITSSRL